MSAFKIHLIDRNRLFAEGLKMLLKGSQLEVSLHFPVLAEYEAKASTQDRPDLIVISINSSLEGGNGQINVLRRICAREDTPVVVLADILSMSQLRLAVSAGVSGYLLRSISSEALQYSLALIIAGEKVVPGEVVTLLLEHHSLQARQQTTGVQLSNRERTILACIANGSSNKQISDTLGIAEGTVKVHLKAVFMKVGARNRTDAAMWSLRHVLATD